MSMVPRHERVTPELVGTAEPPECGHVRWEQQVVVVHLVDSAGDHAGWRVQVKVRCEECRDELRFLAREDGSADAALSGDRLKLGAMAELVDGGEDWPTTGPPTWRADATVPASLPTGA